MEQELRETVGHHRTSSPMSTNAFNAAFNGDVPPFVMAAAKAANFYFFRDNGCRLGLLLQRATSSGSLQKAVNRRLKADPRRLIN